jgi:hypothetical protein
MVVPSGEPPTLVTALVVSPLLGVLVAVVGVVAVAVLGVALPPPLVAVPGVEPPPTMELAELPPLPPPHALRIKLPAKVDRPWRNWRRFVILHVSGFQLPGSEVGAFVNRVMRAAFFELIKTIKIRIGLKHNM